MRVTKIRVLTLSAVVLGSLVIAVPLASAKSYKVSLKQIGHFNGTTITGTISGKPLGKGTLKGKVNFSTNASVQTWKLKGGTIKVSGVVKLTTGTLGVGPWKVLKGTGKYKGVKGGGVTNGDVATGKFTWKGKLVY